MGCDSPRKILLNVLGGFNPRTHMGCDFAYQFYLIPYNKFQSTHPHGVRLVSIIRLKYFLYVSIHAPTWGATRLLESKCSSIVFQSTHPHGVRHCPKCTISCSRFVSIHAPTWGATIYLDGVRLSSEVSIHAPTWGATRGGSPQYRRFACFNPRTHMGCDFAAVALSFAMMAFQSTHPHGVRL